jgi:hypothetical protein
MKTFVLIVLLFIESIPILAQEPPTVVVNALKKKFPSAINIKWVKQSNASYEYTIDLNNNSSTPPKITYHYYWDANFTLNNKKASSSFTSDGHWVWGKVEKPYAELREEVKNAIKRDYGPWCTILSIYLVECTGLGSSYEVTVTCGNGIDESVYNENGWPPPKI